MLRLWSRRERERPVSKGIAICLLPLTLWFFCLTVLTAAQRTTGVSSGLRGKWAVLSLRGWSPRRQQQTLLEVLVKTLIPGHFKLFPPPPPIYLPTFQFRSLGPGPGICPCSKFSGNLLWTLKFEDNCPRYKVRT